MSEAFELFWKAWPKSIRKGGKSTCLAKWKQKRLDMDIRQILAHVEWMKTTEAWKNEAFIPAPLVYLNQMRWDGAEVPDMKIEVSLSFKDPALQKIEEDSRKSVPMPPEIAEKLRNLRKSIVIS